MHFEDSGVTFMHCVSRISLAVFIYNTSGRDKGDVKVTCKGDV